MNNYSSNIISMEKKSFYNSTSLYNIFLIGLVKGIDLMMTSLVDKLVVYIWLLTDGTIL